jgi:hypothetical protein
MRKTILTIVGAMALTSSLFGQANTQGSIIVDPYYGFPNFGKSFYSSLESTSSNFKATGIGPCGLRAEYMISDKIGTGFDFIYNSNKTTYSSVDTTLVYNSGTATYTNVYTTNSYERTMQRIRVQARINFHFDISNPNLDAYFGVGVGTNNRYRKYYQNGTQITDDATTTAGKLTLMPVSMRICTGLRYYFAPNIGVNLELGLGGPMISAGASVRF